MADAESSSPSFFKRHWEGWRSFWGERFSFVDNYNRFIQGRHNPTDSDMDAFIALDPFHGPTVKAAREAAKIAVREVLLEPFRFAWKYSKSPHDALLSLVVGDVFGYTLGQEAASHWLQLYRLDTMTAQVKFLELSKSKNADTA